VDPIVVALLLLVLVPVAIIWALSKSAALRGPSVPLSRRKPVEALVTEVIPEGHPEDEEDVSAETPSYEIESEPPPAGSGEPPSPPAPAA
jgi:hypothetical protein